MSRFKIYSIVSVVVILTSGLLIEALEVSYGWLVLIIGILFFISVLGHFSMSWSFHLKAFVGNKKETRKLIAITFDDGPNHEFTPQVLAILERFDAVGTFFCIGKYVEEHPEILRAIAAKGHAVGNHSFSHSTTIDFNNAKAWLQEIEKTDAAIETITGQKPTLFRPPYGVTTPQLAKALKQTEHKVIGWNVRPFDTMLKNEKKLAQRIVKKIKPGALVLLHDTHKRIPYILEHLLLFLKKNGYQTVLLNDLMHDTK